MTHPAPSFFRTLFLAAIAATSLVVVDSILAKVEREETSAGAARFYREGLALMREGKGADAAELFKSAISNARDNPVYSLALAGALTEDGRPDDAEADLTELLKADSMAGAPNLAMARALAKQGRMTEGISYYHRAIYGQWREDSRGNQVRTRFELADLLASRNLKEDLLAELLPLQDLAPPDAATQERLARLFLTAASPARAATIFRDLVRTQPQDPEAHEGLGEAEFALADYEAAQTSFLAAIRLGPNDPHVRARLDICEQILDLDPTRRGLSGQERYRRSVLMLQRMTDMVAQCPDASARGPLADEIESARATAGRHVSPAGQSDAVGSNLDLANKLWHAGSKCVAGNPALEPLQLVLAKAAQQTVLSGAGSTASASGNPR